jgi:hypothetical protein
MARSADNKDQGQAQDAEPKVEEQNVKTTDGTEVPAQPNDPSESPQARQVRAQAEADEQARRNAEGAAVQERDVAPTEPVTTTTDNDGNQVTLPTSHTGPQQLINGPGENYNDARPGVSAEWAAARTNDEEHDVTQNDGLTEEEAQYQAEQENVDQGDRPETAEQP